MEDRKDQKNAPWLSVPQFGDWDQKGELPDYSVDFSKIREMRKQNKRDASRASLGKEEELINPTATTAKPAQTHDHHHHYHQDHHDSPALILWKTCVCCGNLLLLATRYCPAVTICSISSLKMDNPS